MEADIANLISEMYGRYFVVVLSSWFFVAFLIGCGFAQTMIGLIIMRFLAGIGGSAAMAIVPAIVADLYPIERRSFAMGFVLVRSQLPHRRKTSLTMFSLSKHSRQL
jgi:MFS family permease